MQVDLTPTRFLGQTTKSGAAATGQLWVATVPGSDVVYHSLFTKLHTVTAPNAGHFTPAAYAALRTQGAPVTAFA